MTFRAWDEARVVVGNRYRLGPDDVVVVTRLRRVALGKVTAADARRAGFEDRDELLAMVRRVAKKQLNARSTSTGSISVTSSRRIPARLAEPTPPPPPWTRSSSAWNASTPAAGAGPWTLATLRLIEAHPEVVASKLALRMERETRAFKADVRKLKELGLTVSHDVGYSLSPRGRAVLRRAR